MRTRTATKHARALRFAQLRMQGYTVTDAWVALAPKNKKLPRESACSRASEFANDPVVKRACHEQMSAAKVSQIDSHVEFHTDVQDWIKQAVAKENWTAVAALGRLRGSSGTYMTETFAMSDDRGTSDAQLISRIAALRPDLAPLLGQMLGIPVQPATEQPDNAANGSEQQPRVPAKPLH